ncbi:MAG: CsgG/HfaB family protein [Terriglobales bacterium]
MRAPRALIAAYLALGLAAALFGGDKKDKKEGATPPPLPSTPAYTVTILPFQDFSGSAHGAQLKDALGKHLQFLLVSNTNLRPRLIADEAGNIEAATALGQSQNSDLVIMGTVLSAEMEEHESGGSGFGYGGVTMGGRSKSQDAVVVLQAEVVDVVRGKRIVSLRATGKDHQDKASATSIGTGHGSVDMGSPDFRRSALGKATENALNDLLAQFVKTASEFKPPETGAGVAPAPPVPASGSTQSASENKGASAAGGFAQDTSAPPAAAPADAPPAPAAPPVPAAPVTANCIVILKVKGPSGLVRAYNVTANGTDMSGFVRSGLLRLEKPVTPLQLQVFPKERPEYVSEKGYPGNYSDKLAVGCTKAEETIVLEIQMDGKGTFWWE